MAPLFKILKHVGLSPDEKEGLNMELKNSIKEVGIDFIDSYEKRVKLVMVLMREATRRIDGFFREQDDMIGQLRESLARSGGLRKKDFDTFMGAILARRKEREEGTQHALDELWKEEKEMMGALREVFRDEHADVDLEKIKTEILSRHQNREKEITRMMMELHREQEELSLVLTGLLSKGKNVTVRNFRTMVNTFKIKNGNHGDEIGTVFDQLYTAREAVTSQWQSLFSAYERPAVRGTLSPLL